MPARQRDDLVRDDVVLLPAIVAEVTADAPAAVEQIQVACVKDSSQFKRFHRHASPRGSKNS
jgi:hypothetical protein